MNNQTTKQPMKCSIQQRYLQAKAAWTLEVLNGRVPKEILDSILEGDSDTYIKWREDHPECKIQAGIFLQYNVDAILWNGTIIGLFYFNPATQLIRFSSYDNI